MSFSRRARAIAASQNSVPDEDVLRIARPPPCLPVLRSAFAAFSPQAASGGLKFVEVLCTQGGVARPASRWKQFVRPS